MNEHSQEPDAPVASTRTTDETEASAVKDKNTLQALLELYCVKRKEIQILDYINAGAHFDTLLEETLIALHRSERNLYARTLDLDNLPTLDDYDLLLTMSERCVKKQVECNARDRVIFTKLDEIDALGTQIAAEHASELDIRPTIRARFEEERKLVSNFRMGCLKICWRERSPKSTSREDIEDAEQDNHS